jgi:flagellar motor switch protein FliM
MTDATTLSGDEIAALMSGLQDASPRPVRPSEPPQPFSFGSGTARPVNAIPALDRMNEEMARRLRAVVEPFARTRPRIAAEPIEVRPFDAWKAEQAEWVSLSLYSMKPLKGGILLAIEPEFVRRLVDIFYGGSGDSVRGPVREFSPSEESLLARFADGVAGALADVWQEVVPVRPMLRSRQVGVAHAAVATGAEAVAVSRFTVHLARGEPTTISIVQPLSSLRSVEARLAALSGEETSARGEEWRERLVAAVGEVRIRARTVLARPELQLSELLQIRVGDVIPVSLPAQVPLLVEGRPIALGTIGEHDGRTALRIEKIQRRRSNA